MLSDDQVLLAKQFRGDGGAMMKVLFTKYSGIEMSWCYLFFCHEPCCQSQYDRNHREKVILKYLVYDKDNNYGSYKSSFESKNFKQEQLWLLSGIVYVQNKIIKIGVRNIRELEIFPICQTINQVDINSLTKFEIKFALQDGNIVIQIADQIYPLCQSYFEEDYIEDQQEIKRFNDWQNQEMTIDYQRYQIQNRDRNYCKQKKDSKQRKAKRADKRKIKFIKIKQSSNKYQPKSKQHYEKSQNFIFKLHF